MSESPTLYKTQDAEGKDDLNYVWFEWAAVKDDAASTKEGRPVFDQVLRATVVSPGQTKSSAAFILRRKYPDGSIKTYHHAQKFARQIEQFERSENTPEMIGTPLSELSFLDHGQRATLKAFNVHTAEALGNLSDTALGGMGIGMRALRDKAKAYIDHAAGAAPLNRLADENAKLRAEYDTLRANHDDLVAKVQAMEAKRGPGRPPKAAMDEAA